MHCTAVSNQKTADCIAATPRCRIAIASCTIADHSRIATAGCIAMSTPRSNCCTNPAATDHTATTAASL